MSEQVEIPDLLAPRLEAYAEQCDLGRVALRQGDGLMFVTLDKEAEEPLDIILLSGSEQDIEKKRQAVLSRFKDIGISVTEKTVDADSPLVKAMLQKRGII